jgi:DNA recombination protein RmuC
VKTRGTWGEISLGTLLEQVMAPDQVAQNVEVIPGSGSRVEFAIRLPNKGDGEREILLPIDAKFPHEDYERLVEAAERGDSVAEEAAIKAIEARIRSAAKEICAKYVHAPYSTDFAIMYLPTEGLYAEVLRRPGLASSLQTDCKIVVTGPTTIHALLTSLQVGFRSLAIQKRSSEVWAVLGAVKTEFGKYGDILDRVQKRLRQADSEIESVRVRERAIGRRLRAVEGLPNGEAGRVLQLDDLNSDDLAPALEQPISYPRQGEALLPA